MAHPGLGHDPKFLRSPGLNFFLPDDDALVFIKVEDRFAGDETGLRFYQPEGRVVNHGADLDQ